MKIILVSLLIVLILFIGVIEAVRRGILDTKYSILWIVTCVFMGILSSNAVIINWLGDLLDVKYPPSLLFLFGLIFAMMLIFDLTRRISKLSRQLTLLTQEHALLKQKIEKKGQ